MTTPATTTPLTLGAEAPDFALLDAHGRTLTRDDLADPRLIVYFYPAAFTPGCTAEACDFRDNLATLRGGGYEVVGISDDSVETLARFADEDRLEFPLLSDPDHAAARAYGAWGDKVVNGEPTVGVRRSTFVIDENGRIALAEYDVDPNGHVGRLRARLGV